MLVHFDAPPGSITPIKHSCNMSQLVMRVLVLRNDKRVRSEGTEKGDVDGKPEQGVSDRKSDEGSGA